MKIIITVCMEFGKWDKRNIYILLRIVLKDVYINCHFHYFINIVSFPNMIHIFMYDLHIYYFLNHNKLVSLNGQK